MGGGGRGLCWELMDQSFFIETEEEGEAKERGGEEKERQKRGQIQTE